MARRVVSVLRSGPASLRSNDPALEANAYAVAEDVDLTLVLRGAGVDLALATAEIHPFELAGVPMQTAALAQDLRGLVESGVRVLVDEADLTRTGLTPDDLVAGVEAADGSRVAAALRDAEAVVVW